MSGRNSVFGGSSNDNSVGSINGDQIDYKTLELRVNDEVDKYIKRNPNATADEQMKESFRETVWQQMIQEKIFKPQYDKLGIDITGEEIYAMCTTEEFATEVIKKSFAGQNGVFDPNQAISFIKRLDDDPSGEVHAQWQPFEEAFSLQRLSEKYTAMAKNGIYVTSLEIKNQFNESNKKFTFQYVSQQYANFSDTTLKVSKDELNSFYNKNKEKYKREEEIRKINYVYFDFIPSSTDSAEVKLRADDVAMKFKNTNDDSLFVIQNQGIYDGKSKSKDQLEKVLADSLYNASIGSVYGPYISGGSYKVAKLVKSANEIVDSFKASHILVKINGNTPQDSLAAKNLAYDYMNQIKSGQKTFEIMAMMYGTDGTKEKGGDLGWFGPGMMVKEFEDGIRNTPYGQIGVVLSQFGYHVVKQTAPSKKLR